VARCKKNKTYNVAFLPTSVKTDDCEASQKEGCIEYTRSFTHLF